MNKFVYIACPYCSHSIVLGKFKKTRFSIDPLEFRIYTKREQKSQNGWPRGKGKGHRGFFMVEGSGKTIVDLMNGSPEEQEIGRHVVERIKVIYNAYRTAGLIK